MDWNWGLLKKLISPAYHCRSYITNNAKFALDKQTLLKFRKSPSFESCSIFFLFESPHTTCIFFFASLLTYKLFESRYVWSVSFYQGHFHTSFIYSRNFSFLSETQFCLGRTPEKRRSILRLQDYNQESRCIFCSISHNVTVWYWFYVEVADITFEHILVEVNQFA